MSILLQNYLMNLSEEFSKDSIAYGSVILVITPLLLQALSVIIEEHTLNRLMLIEFEPNKTVSQSIDEFLNNPSIEIKQ